MNLIRREHFFSNVEIDEGKVRKMKNVGNNYVVALINTVLEVIVGVLCFPCPLLIYFEKFFLKNSEGMHVNLVSQGSQPLDISLASCFGLQVKDESNVGDGENQNANEYLHH